MLSLVIIFQIVDLLFVDRTYCNVIEDLSPVLFIHLLNNFQLLNLRFLLLVTHVGIGFLEVFENFIVVLFVLSFNGVLH